MREIPILQMKDVELIVKERSIPILNKINITINKNEFVIILGVNGSGKSSLLKILSSNRKSTSGEVLFYGSEINKIDQKQKAKEMITLTQKPEDRLFSELTLEENITLWESRYDFSSRLNFEQICNLTHNPIKFKTLLKQKISNLSGGEKQVFLFALTIAHPPKILFLDEHTSALDPIASKEIMALTANAIANHHITTIMVTHKLEDAIEYGTRIIILNEGNIKLDIEKTSDFKLENLKKLLE